MTVSLAVIVCIITAFGVSATLSTANAVDYADTSYDKRARRQGGMGAMGASMGGSRRVLTINDFSTQSAIYADLTRINSTSRVSFESCFANPFACRGFMNQ